MNDSYREYDEQYKYANRNFKLHDKVVFVGPPREEENPTFISSPKEHKLYLKKGRIAYGPSEDMRCYPDEPADSDLAKLVWVKFEDDDKDIRQVDRNWLVKEQDLRWS